MIKLQPLVSVLMTSYNREKYIAEAIESVLNSTYKNFELIIVDDASIDNTAKIAREYEKKDERVSVFVNDKNLTQWPNRNKSATFASGDLLMWVDSDDMIKENAIEYVVGQFIANPTINYSTIYHKGNIEKPQILTPVESIRNHYFKEGFLNIGPGGTAIKSEYFKSIGGFPEKYGPVGDMYYNIKAAANTNILLLPYNYLIYRRHENQEINNKYSYLCDGYRYLADLMQFPELPLSSGERKMILKKSARENMLSFLRHIKNTGEIKKAFKAFKISGIKLQDLF